MASVGEKIKLREEPKRRTANSKYHSHAIRQSRRQSTRKEQEAEHVKVNQGISLRWERKKEKPNSFGVCQSWGKVEGTSKRQNNQKTLVILATNTGCCTNWLTHSSLESFSKIPHSHVTNSCAYLSACCNGSDSKSSKHAGIWNKQIYYNSLFL